jgi:hypothetical protein
VTIPSFRADGNLPPGVHDATWTEMTTRFGQTPWRSQLLNGLLAALHSLRAAGCKRAYVDGSFVTDKAIPGDFDGCWEAAGVDPNRLDPALLDFSNARAAQKARFGGELFPATSAAVPVGTAFLDFFQRDKNTGSQKGIIAINLGGLP